MTPDQMRIAILEKLGWEWKKAVNADTYAWFSPSGERETDWRSFDDKVCDGLLNYPYNLNAIKEARKSVITPFVYLRVDYLNHLRKIVDRRIKLQIRPVSDYDLLDAEAVEHAEAFCRTAGIWKD